MRGSEEHFGKVIPYPEVEGPVGMASTLKVEDQGRAMIQLMNMSCIDGNGWHLSGPHVAHRKSFGAISSCSNDKIVVQDSSSARVSPPVQ